MSAPYIILIVVAGVTLLLLMVLKFKLSAFIALLITSIIVGIMAGMPLQKISASIQEGMGSTLGFVATVVGLGAIFGQMLESSGGAKSLANYLLKKFGTNKASWALMLTGFIVGIPIFLDVGLIILIPIVYALDPRHEALFALLCNPFACWSGSDSYNGSANAWSHGCRRDTRRRPWLGCYDGSYW